MNKKRLFIAFPVSPEVEQELRQVQTKFKSLNSQNRIKWVGDEGFHVTIVFLGETDENMIENIKKIFQPKADPPLAGKKYLLFTFLLYKIDAFPNQSEPKVIVVKLTEQGSESVNFQHELVKQLQELGLEIEDRRFTPHLTLGRNKFGDKIFGFEKIDINKISWQVNRIELIESELLPSGPSYTVIKSLQFNNHV